MFPLDAKAAASAETANAVSVPSRPMRSAILITLDHITARKPGGRPWSAVRAQTPRSGFDAQEPAQIDQLANVVGIVIYHQQRLAEQRLAVPMREG